MDCDSFCCFLLEEQDVTRREVLKVIQWSARMFTIFFPISTESSWLDLKIVVHIISLWNGASFSLRVCNCWPSMDGGCPGSRPSFRVMTGFSFFGLSSERWWRELSRVLVFFSRSLARSFERSRGRSLWGSLSATRDRLCFSQLKHLLGIYGQLQQGFAIIPNPVIWECSQNEDLIGRACKLGRQINSRLLTQSVGILLDQSSCLLKTTSTSTSRSSWLLEKKDLQKRIDI